jgi:hypothetical protein
MWPVIHDLSIRGVHADALFASGLQRCDEPSVGQVRMAVATAIRAFGYSGCAARVAQEYGDHPETAVIRMRWARAISSAAFAEPALQPDPGGTACGLHAVRPRFPADQVAGLTGHRAA